jgi:hypothetical protein
MRVLSLVALIIDVVSLPTATVAQEYLDRFNYYGTEQRDDGYNDYGPPDWGDISCDETNALDDCVAYRDKWNTGRDWDITDNYCRWCPADLGYANCGRHHQSPINLERDIGIIGNVNEKECIDVHWMKYEDSSCSLDQMIASDAFTVERHALRITQPITVSGNDDIQIDCSKEGVGQKFGRIDFSKGFSQWWFLSHIDFRTPSEHTQEGKRYDGEIQLNHFYSATALEAGVENELATVSIFMESFEDAAPYLYLDKVMCLWRRHEYSVRRECGLDPVPGSYPGCFPMNRKLRRYGDEKPRRPRQKFQTVQDSILYHEKKRARTSPCPSCKWTMSIGVRQRTRIGKSGLTKNRPNSKRKTGPTMT